MSDLPTITLEWLAAHHGVITTRVLRTHGVARSTITRLADGGVLQRRSPGVFVLRSTPPSIEQRCAVLCATHPSGFVTGPTAGSLSGLRRMPRTSPLHYSIRHGIHIVDVAGVHWRQTTALSTHDRRPRHDGIVLASWARLAFDLAADLGPLDHLSVVNQLVDERRVTVEELAVIERRLGHPARPGSDLFRRTLESLGRQPANQSHPEVVLAEALRQHGVPVVHQARVAAESRDLHVDLAVPELRWGIELDIHPEHRSYEGHADDARRRRQMHRRGWQIEVVTDDDMRDVEGLVSELTTLYRHRRNSHPSTA